MSGSRRYKIIVCRGPECGDRRGSRRIYAAFEQALARAGAGDRVGLDWQSCFGRCTQGPNALVRELVAPEGERRFVFANLPPRRRSHSALYNRLTEADAAVVVDEHIGAGRLVGRLIERPRRAPAPTNSEKPSADPSRDAASGTSDSSGGDY